MRIQDPEKINLYYQALLDRNPDFTGVFFVAVRTTSIFCIATCRARKPKLENVEFYTEFKDALTHGYRPCKICRPTENAHSAPAEVEKAIDWVRNHPKEKIKDFQMRKMGLRPEFLRRWFKQHYGMTFHAFQRMYRINHAFQELKNGKSATAAAFDSGYDSLSGFGYTFKKMTGKSPSETASPPILIHRFTSPLGPMFVAATEKGICLLEFTDRRMLETEFKDLQKRLGTEIIAGENEFTKQAVKEMEEYFAGERKEFSVPLDYPGTDFQRAAWTALLDIPYGETTHYQAQAERLNQPTATRAVAAANGQNRIAIIIPCHRVIGKNGKLTGYGGGIERKKWLLEFERKHAGFGQIPMDFES